MLSNILDRLTQTGHSHFCIKQIINCKKHKDKKTDIFKRHLINFVNCNLKNSSRFCDSVPFQDLEIIFNQIYGYWINNNTRFVLIILFNYSNMRKGLRFKVLNFF